MPPTYEWTEEQASALDLLRKHEDGIFVLAGYAGTGKTTLVVCALQSENANVCFTAPTHKAVGVLSQKGLLPGASYRTLHSLLGCRRHRKNGKTEFLPDFDKAQWGDFDTIVIDEISMVGETIWSWVEEAQALHGRRVICMGDPAQLPPVKDGDGLSPAFELTNAQLTEIMRSEGIVQRAATVVRQNLHAVKPVRVEHGEDDRGVVQKVDRGEFLDAAVEAFAGERDAKVLAWTNRAVDWLNQTIRRALFGEDVGDAPRPGELLKVVKTWASPDEARVLHAGAEVVVDEAERVTLKGVPAFKIKTRDNGTLRQVTPGGRDIYKRTLSDCRFEARRKGNWRPFYAFQDAFIDLRPGYATTVHKSQGSTYRETFVVDSNLCNCDDPEERNMLRYVAFSRASRRLVLS